VNLGFEGETLEIIVSTTVTAKALAFHLVLLLLILLFPRSSRGRWTLNRKITSLQVEVLRVITRFKDRLVRSPKLLAHHPIPIDLLSEERVSLNQFRICETLCRILLQEFRDKINCLWRVIIVEGGVPCANHGEQLISLLRVERGHTCQHFVEDTAEAPPIAGLAVGAVLAFLEDLWGKVFLGATEAVGEATSADVFFA